MSKLFLIALFSFALLAAPSPVKAGSPTSCLNFIQKIFKANIHKKIPRTSIASKILSYSFTLLSFPFPHNRSIISRSIEMSRRDKVEAKRQLEEDSHYLGQLDMQNLVDAGLLNRDKYSDKSWGRGDIRVFLKRSAMVGFNKLTLEDIKSYIAIKYPAEHAKILNKTIDLFYDVQRVSDWVQGLKVEVFQRMLKDGLTAMHLYKDSDIMQLYLDYILAERAKKHGFEINKNGLPFNLYSTDLLSFTLGTLARGKLFIDWTGNLLTSTVDKSRHYSRGHTLQLVYAAEHIPGFVGTIKYLGKTGYFNGAWQLIFDNFNSTSTPLWGGFWVESFGHFLGIQDYKRVHEYLNDYWVHGRKKSEE